MTLNELIGCVMSDFKVITYQLVRVLEDAAVSMRTHGGHGCTTPRILKFGIGV
jgi:hypothetical protein